MKYLTKVFKITLCFMMLALLIPADSFATDVGAGLTIDGDVPDYLNFNLGEATVIVNGNYRIAGWEGIGIVTATINTGTLTYNENFTGAKSVTGDIGTDAEGAGAINVINMNGTGTLTLNGNVAANNGIKFGADGRIDLGSGYIINGAVDNITGSANKGTLTLLGNNQSVSGNIGVTNALYVVNAQAGSDETDTFSGTVNAATINVTGTGTAAFSDNVTGALKFTSATTNGGTISVASGKSVTGTVTTTNDGKGTLTFLGATSTGGTIGSYADTKELYQVNFNGATTLGHNISSATTNIKAGSTTTLSGNRTINGDLTLAASSTAILDVGANTLTLATGTASGGTGVYTQNNDSKLKVTLSSASTSGMVSSSANAVVSATSSVDVTIPASIYVPTGASFTIIDGAGGSNVNVPGSITSSSSRVSFSGTSSSGDLILTANRSSGGFSHIATDSNASNVGNVLDNITNPSGDMATVLNTLELLNNSQTASSLDTVVPEVDAGVTNITTASLNNFIGVALERVSGAGSANTGISSGDEGILNGLWAKGYGSYLTQDTRKGVKGYDAWNAGTAIGMDRLFNDTLTVGISGGYAYGKVDSEVNNGKTHIDSIQTTMYAGYQNERYPYFIDAAGIFAWNRYKADRDIVIGSAIQRTASSEYDGRQYGAYIEGGYSFKSVKGGIELTPLGSLQYSHLGLDSYTETGADSMNLDVNRQSYDILQFGVGARISGPIKTKRNTLTYELHGKWLYDFIGDAMSVTSTFTGGGASFESNGCKPARNSVNLGGKLSMDLKNDISLIGTCDAEIKNEFLGIYGSLTLRREF